MKRKYHRYLLKTFVLAAGFIAGAGVSAAALPDATAALRRAPLPAVLADTATFEWVDSTRINVRLQLGSGDVRITTDDRLILMPRIVSASDDSVYELPPVEFAGRRNKKYFDRRAALDGEPLTRSYLTYEEIVRGGVLELWMGAEPSDFGSAPADRP